MNGSGISYTLPDSIRQGYLQHWNFGIQRELWKQTMIQVDYVGVKGTHLPTGSPAGNCHLPCLFNMTPARYLSLGDTLRDDLNNHPEIPKAYPDFQGTVNQALRPYPQYTTIGLTGFNVGNSTYNALQVQLRKRPAKGGLGFIAAYTFSKAKDDRPDQTTVVVGADDAKIVQNQLNPSADYARSDTDLRHRFVFSPVYEWGRIKWSDNEIARALFSDYTISSRVSGQLA